MRLIGPVDPVGCTHRDAQRLDHVKDLIELTDKLLTKIESLAQNADSTEHSVQMIGKEAQEFVVEREGE